MTLDRTCSRRQVGDRIAPRSLTTVSGRRIQLPDPALLVHLQFRRFAGCPVCDLHLHSFARRHDEIADAAIAEVVVFHSAARDLRQYVTDLPLTVVPDPEKRLYREFGVESSPRALLDPRVWLRIFRGVARSAWGIIARGRRIPPIDPSGGRFGLPADFLIGPDGRVLALKYGAHAYDQWSVDELLEHATSARSRARTTLVHSTAS